MLGEDWCNLLSGPLTTQMYKDEASWIELYRCWYKKFMAHIGDDETKMTILAGTKVGKSKYVENAQNIADIRWNINWLAVSTQKSGANKTYRNPLYDNMNKWFGERGISARGTAEDSKSCTTSIRI